MKVAVDTSVLVRAVVRDDPAQASAAVKVLTDAGLIAVATPCLCEFVWGLLRVYDFQPSEGNRGQIPILFPACEIATEAEQDAL